MKNQVLNPITDRAIKEINKPQQPDMPTIRDFVTALQEPSFTVATGFDLIDEKVKFEAGNAYLIGGCEKSGKSALCMNIAAHLLTEGKTISYVNTEFTIKEFVNRMAGIDIAVPYADITASQQEAYVQKFENTLFYAGIGQDALDFDLLLTIIERHIAKGAKVLFFDNVTTFGNCPPPKIEGWVYQALVMDKLKTLAKQKNIIVFVVLHTKDVPIERTLTTKIKDIIDSNNPSKIFEETVTVMAKPTNANLYGGQRIASQFSGTILIWRPFLKFSDPFFNQSTQIILESFRNAPAGIGFVAIFKGEIPTFRLSNEVEAYPGQDQVEADYDSAS